MTTPNADAERTERIASSDPRYTPRAVHDAQFAPGTIVAGRYRIASILGKGGMGEVYRADDIKLGQAVALKFLPARLARDPMLLSRLHDEVRHGRQVTHPNVCRIYDIGEADGAHFVAMELIDGEDLARLLKRIGRLAHDKAVEITRGIAAGLTAAHAKGILHRDLKPANVMIDSRGDARITDFGLALSDRDREDEGIAGTPAYMAPELLEGQPATIQSDLYALGLVMYELFTGRRANQARTFPERMREVTSEITHPSSHIRDLDPAVERLILRCLESDPARRPRSAREIYDALPGGDPLAAALAAGETPSPHLVAAAGSEGSLSPRTAWILLSAFLLLAGAAIVVKQLTSLARYVPMEKSPEVLEDRAVTLARELGVPLPGSPVAALYSPSELRRWIGRKNDPKWETLRHGPPAVRYRLEYGVSAEESALEPLLAIAPGRTSLEVDAQGRLVFLLSAPLGAVEPRPVDWDRLLAAAGLSAGALQQATPSHAPPVPFDARAAWRGSYPNDRTPIEVEAAAWHGTPSYFRITGPWEPKTAGATTPPMSATRMFVYVVAVTLFGTALFLAWNNFRRRRGDRAGAQRIAAFVSVLSLAFYLLTFVYSGDPLTLLLSIGRKMAAALGDGAVAFVLYLAIEPYLRRRWPDRLISWSRLVAGRFRDPMVGRDVLIGLLFGGAWTAVASSPQLVALLGGRPPEPHVSSLMPLSGFRFMLGSTLYQFILAIVEGALTLTVLVVGVLLLRSRIAAALALFTLSMISFSLADVPVAVAVASAAILTIVAYRFGLLATSATFVTFCLLFVTTSIATPWGTALSLIPWLTVAALAIWAFHTSLGGQRALPALEE